MPSLVTVTLGCKVNQYETEYLREGLTRLGYRMAGDGEQADLCVVNTCTVTSDGDAKSRKAIRRLHRLHPRAEIVVMGCYATRAADEVASLPGVVEVITDKRRMGEFLARLGLVDSPRGIAGFGRRHRAYVKVQDGCRMSCSYCIIPYVRPNLESRPIAEVREEVERLSANGYREIVLVGIHLGHYGAGDCTNACAADAGLSHSNANLAGLIDALCSAQGDFRIRLSSLEASEVTDELLDLMRRRTERICPHLHIPLQSGSTAVLQRMRRPQPVERILERCAAARQALDAPALSTDLIVGFPGETDDDFAATCATVERAGFSKLHVFRFSPRQGTVAADLPDRVPADVQQQRAATLDSIGDRLREEFLRSQLGRTVEVLAEAESELRPGHLAGTSQRYVPVTIPGTILQVGQLLRGRVVGVDAEGLLADAIDATDYAATP